MKKYLLLGLCLLGSCAHSTTDDALEKGYYVQVSLNEEPDTCAQYPIRTHAFLANLDNPLQIVVVHHNLLDLTHCDYEHRRKDHIEKYQYLTQYGQYHYRIPVKEGKDFEGTIDFQNGRVELPHDTVITRETSVTTDVVPPPIK